MKSKRMARVLSFMLSLAVMLTAFAGMTVSAAAASKWDGWLKISSAADLLRMKNSENKFYLTKDIDLKGKLWSEKMTFKGTLDGNGYRIKNLTSTSCGLFSSLQNATIQNLGLYNVNIKATDNIGGFAKIANGTTFMNCYVTGTIETTKNTAAGFVSYYGGSKKNYYSDCVNAANVISGSKASGIEGTKSRPNGASSGSYDFENCINYGKIEGKSQYVSGICGCLFGQMTSCYNLGTIINNNDKYYGAGLAGFASNNAYMTNCATTSDIDIASAASNCLAQADTGVSASKFKKSNTYKGFDFGKTWTINSKINSGRPVLSIMLKNYSASKPTADVKSGTAVEKGTKIKLTTTIEDGVIRYTTNGKTPTSKSKKYEDGIKITEDTTIKAAVFVNGYRAYVVTLKYTVS